jgi:hypothetical protein
MCERVALCLQLNREKTTEKGDLGLGWHLSSSDGAVRKGRVGGGERWRWIARIGPRANEHFGASVGSTPYPAAG